MVSIFLSNALSCIRGDLLVLWETVCFGLFHAIQNVHDLIKLTFFLIWLRNILFLCFTVLNLVALLLEVYLPRKTSKSRGSDAKFRVLNSPQGQLWNQVEVILCCVWILPPPFHLKFSIVVVSKHSSHSLSWPLQIFCWFEKLDVMINVLFDLLRLNKSESNGL